VPIALLRNKDKPRPGCDLSDLPSGIDPIQLRHSNIEQNEIRLGTFRLRHQCSAINRHSHDLELPIEDGLQPFQN
jgi:hypothetical protein